MRTDMQACRLITAAEARMRLGNLSAVSLWRWRRDPRLGFPEAIIIRGNLYFDAAELERWIEAQKAAPAGQLPPERRRDLT